MGKVETVLVTGASGGIGSGMASAFAAAGWNVVIAARRENMLRSLAENLRSSGCSVHALPLDITSEEGCNAASRIVQEKFGGLDLLINNAGYLGPRAPLSDISSAEMLRSLQVNVLGTFQMIRSFLPQLQRAENGRIINISSYLGRHALPDCAAYVAGKFGLEGITQAVHEEEKENGIICVSLGPGMVATDMLRNYLGEEDVSMHRSPQAVGEATVRLANSLGINHAGQKLDLDPWIGEAE